jgi:hypothetical protein
MGRVNRLAEFSSAPENDMPQRISIPLALLLATTPLAAQSEAALREYFEGRTVTPRLAMPGTENGVDVYPGSARPLDYARYADRLKDYGTSIKAGEPVTVTKIKVKSKLIEFQLGGGGYGTFGDETSNVSTASTPKTRREKNLEAELKRETDPAKKRTMREELDDLRMAREREDARNRSLVAEAQEHRKENIRQRRLQSGSRFNIRYADRVPAEALSPDAVMASLDKYVDFGQLRANGASAPASPKPSTASLHKGMLLPEVDAMLGSPATNAERKEGSLKVVERVYSSPIGRVNAMFVEGVLVRYTMTSE